MCTAISKKMCNFAASNQIVSNMKKYLFGAVALVTGSLVACNQANEKKAADEEQRRDCRFGGEMAEGT